MHFPVLIPLGPWRVHPHPVFEIVAYLAALLLYRRRRAKGGDVIDDDARLAVLFGAAVGAAVGAKLLAWLDDPAETWRLWRATPAAFLQGKSIVGGLLGGTFGVELMKKRTGVTTRTGDLFVLPLCVAIAVGRIGCFLSGVSDRTCGGATTVAWGIDMGDGVPRHPLPLYEIAFLLLLAAFLARRKLPNGALFREFMALYLSWRFLIDFLKPHGPCFFGLGGVQIAAAATLPFFREGILSLCGRRPGPP